jgi:predicted dinucleotide-utilizing enzyme
VWSLGYPLLFKTGLILPSRHSVIFDDLVDDAPTPFPLQHNRAVTLALIKKFIAEGRFGSV